jgi:predicted secreted protein
MAATVLTDAKVIINSVNLSTFVRKVTLNIEVDEQDVTAMGGNGYKAMIGGLKDWSVECDFNQDFSAAAVDATLWPLFAQTTTISVNPTSAANSATNPQYTGSVLVSKYTPLDGSVGDVSTITIPFRAAGALTRNIV